MKKSKILLLSMVFFTFTGCSKVTSWETSGIYVNKKGTVTEAIIETFDKDNYSKEELETNINNWVESYNKKAGEDAVTLEKFQIKDKQTKVIMEYNSYKDYKDFNHVELYQGKISDAKDESYDLDTKLSMVEEGKVKKEEQKTLNELKEQDKDYNVIIIREPIQVQVDKAIAYISENVEMIDKKLAQVKESDTLAYLVYES